VLLTIILVVLLFSFLVLAHEFGHFIVARRNGVQVDEFGIGFPPKLWGVQKGKTLYSINALPLGGFVRLKGEQGESQAPDSFAAKGAWVKSKILLAGVTMNLLIAYVIITILLIVGMPPLLTSSLPSVGPIKPINGNTKLVVVEVTQDSVAQKAGLVAGSRIVSLGGVELTTPDQLREQVNAKAGSSTTLVIDKSGEQSELKIKLPEKQGDKVLLGVSTAPETLQRYPWYAAPVAAIAVIASMIWSTLAAFGGLITGLFTKAEVAQTVTGPIGITVIFSQVLKFGLAYVLGLVASISLSLAIINALPLPALDGGRLLIVILQRLGMRITDRIEAMVHTFGFVALIGLMIAVSVADIMRLG
jgi:regulator of sigma E protease